MRGSQRAYAKHRKELGLSGGSHVAVGKAIESGRIKLEADGKIDFAKADASWSRNTDAIQGARNPGGGKKDPAAPPAPRPADVQNSTAPTSQTSVPDSPGGNSLVKAQTMRAVFQAQREKLKFEEESGKKIDADDVRVKAFTRGRAARDKLMSAPAKIGPKIVGLTDLVQVITILEDELRNLAQEIADESSAPV